ncbi:hypothetical protein NDI76_04030 [Halogeometricum sp. S1BR25-6]|uniref:Secreted glycoprotein n=1 Tax=Halogeometricum salsisoli TaxID=2950536 RepID=A0ABU2GAR2_9EURY|nr:hypothetical protein [Halogeometricum sp. S1BR25-6]MDS0297901.1 hypothetical protein [Halogeometricum sp. S1BR25-6]
MTSESGRGQANLLSLAAALVLLTTATVGSVLLANVALAGADTDPGARHAAEALAGRLVAADAPHAGRPNVVSETAIRSLTAADADRFAPSVRGRAVRVRLGDEVLVERGDPDGVRVRRLVRVERTAARTTTVNLSVRRRVALPDRTPSVGLSIVTRNGTAVTAVSANDRLVLRDPNGLSGDYEFRATRVAPPTVSFELEDDAGDIEGEVTVRWTEVDATVEPLAVTVGD